jgi:hypothetical protein
VSDEIKIVINLRGDAATIGIQKPGCDPVFCHVDGGLGAVMTRAGELVAEAESIWASSPLYPRCESKLPSQEAPAVTTTRRQPVETASKPKQPSFF